MWHDITQAFPAGQEQSIIKIKEHINLAECSNPPLPVLCDSFHAIQDLI